MTKTTQYKNTPIGPIPSDWEVKKLGEIGEFKNGINKDKNDFGYGYPMVNLMDIFGINILNNTSTLASLVNASNGDLENYNLKKGDVIFVRSSVKPTGVGLTTLINNDFENVVYSGFLIRFRTKLNFLSDSYKIHCFYAEYFRNNLISKSTISANTNINQVALSSLYIALPPLPEQQKIAEVLSTWDKAIQETYAIIKKLEQRNKALAFSLLTGRERIKNKRITKYHKTNLGSKFPIDWEIKTVKKIFKERKEKSNDQLKYPLYSLTIEKGLTEKTDRYERSFLLKDQESNEYKLIYPNDILFNPMNLRFGAIAKSNIDEVVSVSAYYNSIYKIDENVNLDYYTNLFKTDLFINLYDRIAIGSLLEKKRVHLSNFLELEIPFPPIEEQNAIAAILNTANDELKQYQKKLETLKLQKKGLMQQLLTGKVRTV